MKMIRPPPSHLNTLIQVYSPFSSWPTLLWLTRTPHRNISLLQSAVQQKSIHYHDNFKCEGGSKVRWDQSYCLPPCSLSLSLSVFLSLTAHSDPGWWWPFSGASYKPREAKTSWSEGQTLGCVHLGKHLCSFSHPALWRTGTRPRGRRLVGTLTEEKEDFLSLQVQSEFCSFGFESTSVEVKVKFISSWIKNDRDVKNVF